VDLDLARRQVRVLGALFALRYGALDLQDVLAAQLLGLAERVAGLLWAEDDLHKAGGVAKIDEDEAAVVAPTVNPAGQRDGLAFVGRTQDTAGVALEHSETTIPELRATFRGSYWARRDLTTTVPAQKSWNPRRSRLPKAIR